MSNLSLKMKIASRVVSCRSSIDFKSFNNVLNEYCKDNMKMHTFSNIEMLLNDLDHIKLKFTSIINYLVYDNYFTAHQRCYESEFYNATREFTFFFCRGFDTHHFFISILDSLDDFVQDISKYGASKDVIFSACCLFLRFIEVDKKYINVVLKEVSNG